VLDNFGRPNAARAAQVFPGGLVGLSSSIRLALEDSVNANAGPLSVQDIDARLAAHGVLMLIYRADAPTELDCRGLRYCSPGGSGVRAFAGPPADTPANGPAFPSCCDADGDGFGTLTSAGGLPGLFFLSHLSTTSQIGTGDVLIARITRGGVETQHPTALQTIFATAPTLMSWSDGAGHSANITYPVPPPYTGSPPSNTRMREGFKVGAGPGGDVVLTLTFWRPQRQAIPGEEGQWIDMGGLLYGAAPQNLGSPPGPRDCPSTAYSSAHPELAPEGSIGPTAGFRDRAGDRSANAANTLTFSLNITQCLAAHGLVWNTGEPLEIAINARSGTPPAAQDIASQRLFFLRDS
jgi:hypothetical protein